MTTLIFVLVWVVLGLALLLIAFSGGPSGAMQQVMSQTRGARKLAIVLFSLLALALGVLIPAAVIAAVSNRDDIPEANVTDLTASEKNGRELFGQRCANCHTLKAANAIAAIGPNLDELRPTKDLVLNAIENGRANGNGQMAAGLYTGQDAEDVANFVAKAVGQTAQPGGGEGEGGSGGESDGEEGESGGGEGEGGRGGESGGEEGGSGGGEDESGGASSSG
jgi:mono/diheme cytochrome c family protein